MLIILFCFLIASQYVDAFVNNSPLVLANSKSDSSLLKEAVQDEEGDEKAQRIDSNNKRFKSVGQLII